MTYDGRVTLFEWNSTIMTPPPIIVPLEIDLTKPIILVSITMFFAVMGNLFLIFIIFHRSRHSINKISPVQVLIVHSCIGDVLFAILTLLPQIVKTITFPYFYGGTILCKVHMYTSMIPLWASPFMLIAISTDRYIAICKPLTALRYRKRWTAQIYAGIAWMLSLVFALPQLIIFKYNERDQICSDIFRDHQTLGKVYMLYFSVCAWLIPSCIAGFMYTNICYIVWKSLSDAEHIITTPEIRDRRERASFDANSMNYVSRLRVKDNRTLQAQSMEQQKIKTVKLTLTIVSLNFMMWAPFCISNVVKIFSPGDGSDSITPYIMMLGNLNSCVNPWIYVVFNTNQVKEVFCGNSAGAKLRAYQNGKLGTYAASDPGGRRTSFPGHNVPTTNACTLRHENRRLLVASANANGRRSTFASLLPTSFLAEICEDPESGEYSKQEHSVDADNMIVIGRARYHMNADKSEFSLTKDGDSFASIDNDDDHAVNMSNIVATTV